MQDKPSYVLNFWLKTYTILWINPYYLVSYLSDIRKNCLFFNEGKNSQFVYWKLLIFAAFFLDFFSFHNYVKKLIFI